MVHCLFKITLDTTLHVQVYSVPQQTLTVRLNQAFSQTLKTGCPEGVFSHKIIRD